MSASEKNQRGYTLVELIVMLVVMGILAAYVSAKLDFAAYDAGGCADTVKASIRMAQKLAIAKRTSSTVSVAGSCAVSVGTESYPALNGVNVTNSGSVVFNGLGQPSVGGTLMTAVRTFTITGGGITRYVCLEAETGYVHEESASCG